MHSAPVRVSFQLKIFKTCVQSSFNNLLALGPAAALADAEKAADDISIAFVQHLLGFNATLGIPLAALWIDSSLWPLHAIVSREQLCFDCKWVMELTPYRNGLATSIYRQLRSLPVDAPHGTTEQANSWLAVLTVDRLAQLHVIVLVRSQPRPLQTLT